MQLEQRPWNLCVKRSGFGLGEECFSLPLAQKSYTLDSRTNGHDMNHLMILCFWMLDKAPQLGKTGSI